MMIENLPYHFNPLPQMGYFKFFVFIYIPFPLQEEGEDESESQEFDMPWHVVTLIVCNKLRPSSF